HPGRVFLCVSLRPAGDCRPRLIGIPFGPKGGALRQTHHAFSAGSIAVTHMPMTAGLPSEVPFQPLRSGILARDNRVSHSTLLRSFRSETGGCFNNRPSRFYSE